MKKNNTNNTAKKNNSVKKAAAVKVATQAAPVAEKKVRTRTCVEPLTADEAAELQTWLLKHKMCIKDAKKNIRVYRYLGHKNNKILTSQDFVYVVGADAYRENPEQVHMDILKLSKQVMNSHREVKNGDYVAKMAKVEEDLLMNHKIHMIWTKSKTVKFMKFNHVITDASVLAPLNTYVKNNTAALTTNRIYETKDNKHLEIFQKMAQIFEEFDPSIPFYDWKSFRYITKNGQVVAAYSRADMSDKIVEHFEKGIQDKFGYNLNIMKDNFIDDVVAKFN